MGGGEACVDRASRIADARSNERHISRDAESRSLALSRADPLIQRGGKRERTSRSSGERTSRDERLDAKETEAALEPAPFAPHKSDAISPSRSLPNP